MIYYSTASLEVAHMAFIGRWSPFHKGHAAIIEKKLKDHPEIPILILIRNTSYDQYPPIIRAGYIKSWMIQKKYYGTIMIVPNIEGVYWGRGVGYKTEYVEVDEEMKKISATNIRSQMEKENNSWKNHVASKKTSYMLSARITKIVEQGLVVWFTGCPASGKSTIASHVLNQIDARYPHLKTQLLDGDAIRLSPLAAEAGYTLAERTIHLQKMAYLAKMFADQGILVICTFVSPLKSMRANAKQIIGEHRFIEVYIEASKKNRIARDPKGLYKKAIGGRLRDLTGYNSLYEPPDVSVLTCNTNRVTADQSARKVFRHIFS